MGTTTGSKNPHSVVSLTFRGCVGCGIKRIRCPPGTPWIIPAVGNWTSLSETLLSLLSPPTPLPSFLPYLNPRLGILAGRSFLPFDLNSYSRAGSCVHLSSFSPYASPGHPVAIPSQHAEIAWRLFNEHHIPLRGSPTLPNRHCTELPLVQGPTTGKSHCDSLTSPLSFPSFIVRRKAPIALLAHLIGIAPFHSTSNSNSCPARNPRISTPPSNPLKASWVLPTGGI